MNYRYIATVFLTSLSFVGAIATKSFAQERPKCYIIDNSGKLTDLTDICNVSQKRSPNSVTTTTSDGLNIINNNIIGTHPSFTKLLESDNQYFLGDNNFSFDLGSIDSSYYIDNGVGLNYTAYLRQYQIPPTSLPRRILRKKAFQFDDQPRSLTSVLRQGGSRLPFIIYRYPAQ